jgi:DNA-binding NarL/FixJ family response regulator
MWRHGWPTPGIHVTRFRLLLADDHEELLAEVTELLSREFEIVGAASDGATLLAMAATLQPDVVVTDVKMPKLGGIDAGRRLLARGMCKAVVVLTVFDDPQLAQTALQAGIQGYVLKVNAGEDLIPAIYKALDGGTFVSSAIASKLVE